MEKIRFLVIYPTYKRLGVAQRILPYIIQEVEREDAKLMVHDCSIEDEEKREYLLTEKKIHDFFLISSDNMSMAHSRNLCLQLGQELYAPEIICIIEDDHGFKPGFIPAMSEAIDRYYGRVSPNGLRYGLFTACHSHLKTKMKKTNFGRNLFYPTIVNGEDPFKISGPNNCCRVATTQHWNNVIRNYDTDEYLISNYQSMGPNIRNYNKGFTSMLVGKAGQYMFDLEENGRGEASGNSLKLWDRKYAKSDPRSEYLGKKK